MKNRIDNHIKSLNSVGVESSLLIFRDCFSFLSFSFEKLSVEQLSDWIKQLKNPSLDSMWERQKEMKFPSFILYFAMWYFRNKTLQEKEYSREFLERQSVADINHKRVMEITNKINREIDELSAFDGVIFLGSLIGAWMLTCPRIIILSETNSMQNEQPNKTWLNSIYPNTLWKDESSDELELLYRLDYHLYWTFEDLEAHNSF